MPKTYYGVSYICRNVTQKMSIFLNPVTSHFHLLSIF